MVTSTTKGKKLHEIDDWNSVLAAPFKKSFAGKNRQKVQVELAKSMNEMFGAGSYDAGDYAHPHWRGETVADIPKELG